MDEDLFVTIPICESKHKLLLLYTSKYVCVVYETGLCRA